MKNVKTSTIAVISAFTILLSGLFGFGGSYLAINYFDVRDDENFAVDPTTSETPIEGHDTSQFYNTQEIAELVGDTVVSIQTEISGDFWGSGGTGNGSGVIISEDGLIVTNHHVIEDANSILITMLDGTEYYAELLGSDAQTDVAILKIDATGLSFATMADSDELVPGEPAIVIGNALGYLGGSVTSGDIAATGRTIDVEGLVMDDLIQLSVSINGGNSGGGVFNEHGELVGIVVARSVADNAEGVGFAIPINVASSVVDDLLNQGYVGGRIRIGIMLTDIYDVNSARELGVNEYGVYITEVQNPDSGFEAMDMIVSFDGVDVENTEHFLEMLHEKEVGDVVTFEVVRDNKIISFDLALPEFQG